jgi:hypothetical protein
MKNRIFGLCFFALTSGLTAQADSNSSRTNRALGQARSHLKNLENRLPEYRELFKAMRKSNPRIMTPPDGLTFNECNSTHALAFVKRRDGLYYHNDHIFMCSSVFLGTDQDLVQALFHELYHVAANNDDECGTTDVELWIMYNLGLVPFASGHAEVCFPEALKTHRFKKFGH